MRKIFLLLPIILLNACSSSDNDFPKSCRKLGTNYFVSSSSVKDACANLGTVNWTDKYEAKSIYEKCIARLKPELMEQQLTAMLYLSYIYLEKTEHIDIDRANDLLDCAKDIMTSDCVDMYGSYPNMCWFKNFPEDLPKRFEKVEDAFVIYQLSSSAFNCVYLDMIKDNAQAIKITESYFGSSRDLDIPQICQPYDPYQMLNIEEFTNNEHYENLLAVNPGDEIEGTIRFGYRRQAYSDAAFMLAQPELYFKNQTMRDVYIPVVHYENKDDAKGKEINFYATQLERQIRKYKDLSYLQDYMIDRLQKHYMQYLGMDTKTAVHYARLSVMKILLGIVAYD